jgi:hypothetical protein
LGRDAGFADATFAREDEEDVLDRGEGHCVPFWASGGNGGV